MNITMKCLLRLLSGLVLIAGSVAQNAPEADGLSAAYPIPTITGTLEGSRVAIFKTPQDSCTQNDIPDAMARAFRDYKGTIHFVSASSDMFQSLGPTLDSLEHSCEPAYRSENDPNPADFNDQSWLDSFFTLDGKNVAALTHTEFHGWSHPGECHAQGNNQYTECEYDSDTYHLSRDGGYHFESFKAPKNFLAGIPYKYAIDRGPMGYSVDTNVVEFDGWYYAVATDWTWPPNCSGDQGPHRCLVPSGGAPIRTGDVLDPSSWRGWDGRDFSLSFVDPYLDSVSHPKEHVYTPVPYMGFVNAINVYQSGNLVVATLWDYWDNELGPPGLYLTTSIDLVNWTKPRLVITLAELSAHDPKGSWLYAYFSLLDPAAPDLNFSIIGDHPYLYYVRLDNNDAYHRVLFRQRIKLTLNPMSAFHRPQQLFDRHRSPAQQLKNEPSKFRGLAGPSHSLCLTRKRHTMCESQGRIAISGLELIA